MVLPPVSDACGLQGSGWFFDELQNRDGHVFVSFVWGAGEVVSYTFGFVRDFNISQVVHKPVFDSEQGLTDILYATDFAGDGVNKIRAATQDVFHCVEGFVGVCAGDFTTFVQEWAISAIFSVAEIETPVSAADERTSGGCG